jgi:putative peptidoglycan lipid II flippase
MRAMTPETPPPAAPQTHPQGAENAAGVAQPVAPEGAESLGRRSARATGHVSIAILCSRLLGLVREMAFASFFGGGPLMDAFKVAFKIPNLLRDLFAEGALSVAFVTTFTKKFTLEGEDAAWRLGNKVATLTAVFMSAVTLLGLAAAPLLVNVLARGFDNPEQLRLTVWLTRLMFPFILLVSLAALVMGMLNARRVFFWPAMASSFFNLGSILSGVGLAFLLDRDFGPRALTGLAIGTLIGGGLQLFVQFPSLRKLGYRLRPDFRWNDPGVRQVLALMGPAIIAASAVQVNVMVNTVFASHLEAGAISWLEWAFRLMQLPIGLFGVAVATVTLPQISADAALEALDGFRTNLARGLRLALALTIPCTIGLMMLSVPIISLIYQRGNFDAADTLGTAGALQFYVVGLAAYAGIKVIAPAFYSLGMKTVPMMVSFLSIGVNLVMNWFFTFHLGMGVRGLALSTGLVALCNFSLLYGILWKRLGRLEGKAMLAVLAKLALAGGALAAICWAGLHYALVPLGDHAFPVRALALGGVIGAGAAVYFGVAILLRVEELANFTRILRRRIGK